MSLKKINVYNLGQYLQTATDGQFARVGHINYVIENSASGVSAPISIPTGLTDAEFSCDISKADLFEIDLSTLPPIISDVSIKLMDGDNELELNGAFKGPKQIAIKHSALSGVTGIDIQGVQYPLGVAPIFSYGQDKIDIVTLSVGVFDQIYGVASVAFDL